VSVRRATANGTATAGSDYLAKTEIVSFAPGTTTEQMLVVITGDGTLEPNETCSVTLSAARRAKIADPSGLVTITNDDPMPAPPPSAAVAAAAPTVVTARVATLAAPPASPLVIRVTSDWGSGFNGDVTVRNTTGAA